jgi:hypothetical protein
MTTPSIKTKKVTFYLTEQINIDLVNIYAMRINRGLKTDKSSLVCEAILLLLEKESKNHTKNKIKVEEYINICSDHENCKT